MGIRKDNTQWIFMLTTSSKIEDRHLNDIIFGVKILLSKNVPIQNISLIIDEEKDTVLQKMAPLLNQDTTIYKYSDIGQILSSLDKDNIVITVTGHGGITGIDNNPPIKPYDFLHTIKINSTAKNVFILLGQCYAGIFNLMRVTKGQKKGGAYTPHIVIIGAANISTSISLLVKYDNVSWDANIMLAAFFQWLETPIDIDGDKRYSFIDAFKYITYITNNECQKIDKRQHIETIQLINKYSEIQKKLEEKPEQELTLDDILTIQSIERKLSINYVPQETWILNSSPALNTDVKL